MRSTTIAVSNTSGTLREDLAVRKSLTALYRLLCMSSTPLPSPGADKGPVFLAVPLRPRVQLGLPGTHERWRCTETDGSVTEGFGEAVCFLDPQYASGKRHVQCRAVSCMSGATCRRRTDKYVVLICTILAVTNRHLSPTSRSSQMSCVFHQSRVTSKYAVTEHLVVSGIVTKPFCVPVWTSSHDESNNLVPSAVSIHHITTWTWPSFSCSNPQHFHQSDVVSSTHREE